MELAIVSLRLVAAAASVLGVVFLAMPATTAVEPFAAPASDSVPVIAAASRGIADSLAEDIILYNLFAPSRTPPSHRTLAGTAPDESSRDTDPERVLGSSGFTPELIGTAVSATPGETRALLRLHAGDAAPRLYAVGDRAGGYQVISIDPRSVVLSGPRGRIVLRLPENEENHS